MKKVTFALAALVVAMSANAQTSTANSGSLSGSDSTSTSGANSAAIGNINASQSNSASMSGADSRSNSGAMGNSVYVDQRGPVSQTVNQTTRAEQILSGHTVEDVNIRNSGTSTSNVVSSGGTYDRQDVHYSGTQTIKNVPGIAMSGPASGPCTGVSGGLSAAGPGFGIGLNGSAVMVDCRLRENSRVLGMAMQSFDGAANPQEKGEVTVMFMDSLRALAGYNAKLVSDEKITPTGRK